MLVKSQVKYIQSLSQKKQRDAEGVFVAEGPKLINELLCANNIQPVQIYAVPEWIKANPVKDPGIITEVSEAELPRLSFLQTSNQVTGIFKKPVFPGNIQLQQKISLLLDAIQDPGNMGSIIRCADWFGIELVIAGTECADVFNPKVVQATMGSISRVQVVYAEPEQLLEQHAGIPVYASTLDGTDLSKLPALKEGVIIIGNESKGIRESLLALSQHRITIPRRGTAESLNAAVATGIILAKLTGSI
jgi:RNA methyltransferase, TrmH family